MFDELVRHGADPMETSYPLEPLWLPPPARIRHTTPEKRLLIAVLEEALLTLERRSHKEAKDRREAREWVMSESREGLFAFHNICDVLELDADQIRRLFSSEEP